MRQIRELFRRYNISIVNVVERCLRPQVHALLLRHWRKVEAVTAALLDARTLSAAEIDTLFAAAAVNERRTSRWDQNRA